ncbi:MAG TPA: hypothetical protein VLK88_08255, partial [Gemmatimonadales bacterium]|nr:hypothetical protein [Gemmatimonadales bacterium]
MSAPRDVKDLIEDLEQGGISRREFVTRAAAFGLGLGAIGGVLAACREPGKGAHGESSEVGPIEKEL